MRNSKLSQSIRLAILCSLSAPVALISNSVLAEEAAQKDKNIEVIAITGSRIRQVGAESVSPIISIGEKELGFYKNLK